MKRLTLLFITIIALLSNTASSQDQKAVETLESMQERYEQSIKDIDDYIMEEEDQTIYYKKAYTDDGKPYFKTKTKGAYMESTSSTNKDFYSQLFSQAKEKAIYKGTDEVDGNNVHVIYIDQMEIGSFNPNKDAKNTIENIFLYVDSDKLVDRKMEYTMKSQIKGGEVREMSLVVKKRDYRNVEGMLIPYEKATVVNDSYEKVSKVKKIKTNTGMEDF
ncbi:MAG: hypothetical protein K9I74_15045 [Bacteroidales bacterium]|nr:hypothetical protein [Bacteroidales bacterium]